MSILVIAPIFVPNDVGLEVQVKSLESFTRYLSKYKYYGLDFAIGGWCANEDYWYALDQLFDFRPLPFNRNYGKAYVVNTLFEKYKGNEYDYIFTFDSDMKFDENEPDMFDRLIDVVEELPKITQKPFGLLSLNQKEHSCQLYHEYNNHADILNEKLSWADHGCGLAGGCLFISSAAFLDVNGYRVMGVYDGDDGLLMWDFATKGYFSALIQSMSVIHPAVEYKEGYNSWKGDLLHKRRTVGDGTYKEKLEDAETYWGADVVS